MKTVTMSIPRFEPLVPMMQSPSDEFTLKALLNPLRTALYDWAALNETWPAIEALLSSSSRQQVVEGLRSLCLILSALQAAFQSMVEQVRLVRRDRVSSVLEQNLLRLQAFGCAPEHSEGITFTPVAFPGHLQAARVGFGDGYKFTLVSKCLQAQGIPMACPELDACFGAISEDIHSVLELLEPSTVMTQGLDETFGEMWRLADHSERHCDMAIEEIRDVMRVLTGTDSDGEDRGDESN